MTTVRNTFLKKRYIHVFIVKILATVIGIILEYTAIAWPTKQTHVSLYLCVKH